MDPTQLRDELTRRIERARTQEREARKASDSGLMLIHRARAGAFKEALALLDKLTVEQP
jgi:hypothetical protein